MNRLEYTGRTRKKILIVLLSVFFYKIYSQSADIEHYKNIVNDTLFSNGNFGVREVFYLSESKLKKKKGEIKSIKFYKDKRLVYKKVYTGAYFEEFYFNYDEKNRLISEYQYNLGKFPKSFTIYNYDEYGRVSNSINTTENKIYKLVFSYSTTGEIREANLIVNNKFNYFKYLYLTETSNSGIIKKISLVTDTSSNFKKIDTLSIEYIDLKQNSSIYIAKSKNLNIFTFKSFGKNNLLQIKSTQVLDGVNSFFSEYTDYQYPNNDGVFMLEQTYYGEKKKGYSFFYKIPYNLPLQPEFKFLEDKRNKK